MIIIINNKLQKIIIASNEITKNKNLNFILQKYKKERKKERKIERKKDRKKERQKERRKRKKFIWDPNPSSHHLF